MVLPVGDLVHPNPHQLVDDSLQRLGGQPRCGFVEGVGVGAAERHFVGVFEVAADGQSAREFGDLHAERRQHPHEVGRGRFAFKIGVRRKDDLFNGVIAESLQEFLDAQLVRADARNRRNCAAQHVVAAAELTRPLDCDDIFGLLDDAEDRVIAPRILADTAFDVFGDIAAYRTEMNLRLDVGQHRRKTPYILRIGIEKKERDALRALGADAGKAPEFIDQILDYTVIHQMPSAPRSVDTGSSRPVNGPSSAAAISLARVVASRIAATTRSASVSVSEGSTTSGLMSRLSSSPIPVTLAETRPPATEPSTSRWASRSWTATTCSCIFCACSSNADMSGIPSENTLDPLSFPSAYRLEKVA